MDTKPRSLDRIALLFGQWFSCGLSPKAPGTVGSLGAIPLFWVLQGQTSLTYWSVSLVVTLLGFWASQRCAELLADKDPQSVVIDEVAGVLIAMGVVKNAPFFVLALAWGLFRFFDITKPGIIDRAQHWPPHGVGIMADDLIAGCVAGAIAFGLWQLLPL